MEAVGTVAGNVGNREDKAVVTAVAFRTTTSHRGQEAQEGSIRGRGNCTAIGNRARRVAMTTIS